MNYVDYCLKLYKSINNPSSEKFSLSSNVKSLSLIDLISQNYSSDQLRKLYNEEIRVLLDNRLSLLKIEDEYTDELKKLSYYYESVGGFTMSLIFWIEHNKVKLSKEELYKISDAMLIGSIGYRLIDVHNDEGLLGKESSIIGNYFIHNYEEILLDIFRDVETFKIISKNISLYSHVEFLEKRNRWKTCPFNWDEPEKVGLKISPMFSIFELVLRIAKKDEKEIDSLLKGLIYFSAAIQMLDDFTDVEEDLTNGIETLVMSGFYKNFGTDIQITRELVQKFLNEERVSRFYNITQSLFDKARNIFTENEDDIMLLSVEIQNYNFNSRLV